MLNRARIMLVVAFVLVGALALVGSAPGGASPALTASAARGPTVKLERTNLGKILVDGSGYTLYLFTRDHRRQDRCAPVSGCLDVWPALTTAQRPVAGAGVKARLLGTIKFHGNVRQVTYAGHPLYTYSGDFAPRSTDYVGAYQYGGSWYAVDAAGKALHTGGF